MLCPEQKISLALEIARSKRIQTRRGLLATAIAFGVGSSLAQQETLVVNGVEYQNLGSTGWTVLPDGGAQVNQSNGTQILLQADEFVVRDGFLYVEAQALSLLTPSLASAGFALGGGLSGLAAAGLAVSGLGGDDQPPSPPQFGAETATAQANENSKTITFNTSSDLDVSDDDSGPGQLIYSISGGDDQSFFEIDSNGGTLKIINGGLDFESISDANNDNIYEVEVTVTDQSGLTDTIAVSVTVNDVDEVAPTFDNGSSISITLDELSGANQVLSTLSGATDDISSVTYSLSGTDAALFSVDTSGNVTLADNPDFETKASYALVVTASDVAGNSSDQAVTVNVSDLLELTSAPTSNTSLTGEAGSTAGSGSYGLTNDDYDVSGLFGVDSGAGSLTFTSTALPTGFSLNGSVLSWDETTASPAGAHSVTITAEDAVGGQMSATIDYLIALQNDFGASYSAATTQSVTGSALDDVIVFGDSSASGASGNLTVDSGDGNDQITFGVRAGENGGFFSVSTGDGDDSVTFGERIGNTSGGSSDTLTSNGTGTVNLGSGADTFTVNGLMTNGNKGLTVDLGASDGAIDTVVFIHTDHAAKNVEFLNYEFGTDAKIDVNDPSHWALTTNGSNLEFKDSGGTLNSDNFFVIVGAAGGSTDINDWLQ